MKALKNNNIALIGVIPKVKINNPQNLDDKPPKWFETWFSNFKKENDAHWAKQEEFNKLIIKRLDNLVKKNNLKE